MGAVVESSRWGGRGRVVAVAVEIALAAAALAVTAFLFSTWDLRAGPNEFDVAGWETRNFANKWLYAAGEAFRADRDADQEDEDLRRFFVAVADVTRLERNAAGSAASDLSEAISRRDAIENRVEATIESRITAIAKREGLTRNFGLLGDAVWPPVDMEFTTPPRSLAVSSRSRIELLETTLLEAGMDLDHVERIERDRESRGDVSALALPTSGVGAYPSVVSYTSDYRDAVEVAAHEWMHNYLSFRPLGLRYFENNDLRTMNETVADLVGEEIARLVVMSWPGPNGGAEASPPLPTALPTPAIDFRDEMVKLRGEVDALLGEGKITEAEALMEQRRQYLAANGYYLRRINQAYFAFTNLYAGKAGSPGAVNPIGPKIDELRRLSPSLAAFVRTAGGLKSVAGLDRALADLRGP